MLSRSEASQPFGKRPSPNAGNVLPKSEQVQEGIDGSIGHSLKKRSEVVGADVGTLDLPFGRVERIVGEDGPLEGMDYDRTPLHVAFVDGGSYRFHVGRPTFAQPAAWEQVGATLRLCSAAPLMVA